VLRSGEKSKNFPIIPKKLSSSSFEKSLGDEIACESHMCNTFALARVLTDDERVRDLTDFFLLSSRFGTMMTNYFFAALGVKSAYFNIRFITPRRSLSAFFSLRHSPD
jgi:hypothetical protein